MTALDEVSALKRKHHATWAAGDYSVIARLVEAVAKSCVERAGVEPAHDVLDVATGTGNTALLAAGSGARVTGLDLTPELFGVARDRARDLGVDVQWVEGDAEALPFEDERFDRTLSSIGVQFAPRHEVVAAELVRVTRPGGEIVLGNWAADGMIGELFRLMGSRLPAPPPFVSSPSLWGDEEHVRGLFAPHGVELSFERRTAELAFESPDAYVDYFDAHYGPTIKAREALEPSGAWEPLRAEFRALTERFFDAERGVVLMDYWVIAGQRP
jgi:SAM-dependent methyltransferase